MYDNSLYFSKLACEKSNILGKYNLCPDHYVLTTIHRDNNTDNPERLTNIFRALIDVSEQYETDVIIPLHPRTAKLLEKNVEGNVFHKLNYSTHLKLVPPASFFEIIVLERNAKIVMTDSGGVQKEAFFFEKPCVIFRPETEWTEIVEYGAGVIADANYQKIIDGYTAFVEKQVSFPKLFGDANAAEHILKTIIDYLN